MGRDTALTGEIYGLGAALRWLGFAAAGAALLVAAPRVWRRRPEAFVVAAIALTALDLLAMGRRLNPAIATAQAAPPTPPAIDVMRRLTAGGGRVVGIHGLQPNTASRWGLEDARGHEDPWVEREHRLWFALGGGIETASVGVAPEDPRTPKLLDVFGVRAVLFDPSALPRGRLGLPPAFRGYRVAYAGPGGVVAENRSALPRAFVAYRWRRSSGLKASLASTAAGTALQARDEPVIETSQPPLGGPPTPATAARLVSRTDTSVALDVQARAPGQLVVLDTFYPGWRAEVDGRRTPIRPADAAFQSVAVGAGRHRVRFSYRPASVVAGGAITLVALAVLVVGLLLGWRRRDPRSVGK